MKEENIKRLVKLNIDLIKEFTLMQKTIKAMYEVLTDGNRPDTGDPSKDKQD